MMPLLKVAVIIICVVMVLAPISIYVMLKHGSLDSARKRFKKHHRFLYPDERDGEA